MYKWSTWLCLIILPFPALATPDAVTLNYPVGRAVRESSQWSTTIQTGNGVQVYNKKAQADLELKETASGQGMVTKPPFTLQVILKGIQVGADGNKSAHFDSDLPEKSKGMQEIAKMRDVPVELTIGDHLQISSKSDSYREVNQDLKQAGAFQLAGLFTEMVQHLFALAGQDLHKGDRIQREVAVPGGSTPIKLEYEVVAITPQEVRAVIRGDVPQWTMSVKQGLIPVEGADSAGSLTLAGTVLGKVVWSRSNALMYKAKIDYDYQGTITANGRESPVSMQLHHLDSTSRL